MGAPSWRAVVAVMSAGIGERAARDSTGRDVTPLYLSYAAQR
jgi:hypothetical protein